MGLAGQFRRATSMAHERTKKSMSAPEARSPSILVATLPLMAAVFAVFLVTGVALPALPLHISQRLGLGDLAVGLIAGAQFAASLISRVAAGAFSDARGAKPAVLLGLAMATAAGLLYALSLASVATPLASASILLAGRAALGCAESFVIVGSQSWGLALAGVNHVGKVIAWLGIAMYAAFAVGAPIGSALFATYGFAAISTATVVAPIATLVLVGPLARVAPRTRRKVELLKVAAAVSAPGAALALSSVGFGVMTAFSILLFVERGWRPAWLAYTLFAVSFVAARLVFGHLPDRRGGAKIAAVFGTIEAAGFAALSVAPWSWLGFFGAALVGFGYSLVFPGLGIEAVRRVPAESQGLAIGVYTAYLDVALGVLLPLLGLIGGLAGLGPVFLASSFLAFAAVPVALSLSASSR
jgi:MFS family permease